MLTRSRVARLAAMAMLTSGLILRGDLLPSKLDTEEDADAKPRPDPLLAPDSGSRPWSLRLMPSNKDNKNPDPTTTNPGNRPGEEEKLDDRKDATGIPDGSTPEPVEESRSSADGNWPATDSDGQASTCVYGNTPGPDNDGDGNPDYCTYTPKTRDVDNPKGDKGTGLSPTSCTQPPRPEVSAPPRRYSTPTAARDTSPGTPPRRWPATGCANPRGGPATSGTTASSSRSSHR